MTDLKYLEREGSPRLAYVKTPAQDANDPRPYIVFLGGYNSDMGGTKAVFLEDQCKVNGQGFLRLDYSGHGDSDGDFDNGTIGQWAQDALDVIKHACPNQDVILVGSSMGGWIGLLLSLKYKTHVKGFVGIAAAPDFTIGMYNQMTDEQQQTLNDTGIVEIPNDYSDEPYRVTKALIDDGADNALLDEGIDIDIPVCLIQGKRDADVPWEHALRVRDAIKNDRVTVTLIDEADHRVSRPEDLEIIASTVDAMSAEILA